MIARQRCILLLASWLFVLSTSLTFAQTQTSGRIAGTVKDQNGAVIAGANVTVMSRATGDERKVTTDKTGDYTVLLLPSDIYQVSITARGLKQAIFNNVHVVITETTVVNAELEVGAVKESVTISTAGPLVQTDGPQRGRVVDSRSVSELPLATRNYTQILGLSPGVATYLPDNTATGRNSQNISVNGARGTQNNYQINGVDANLPNGNGMQAIAVPAPETVQEFKVQTSLYDATAGRSGGGSIQVVTKSGSNFLHGAAYEYFRNDALNANNPVLKTAGVKRPVLRRNIFGGLLGGPIKEDRTFFFISYQGTRESNGASRINSLSSNVLVASGLTDDRSEQTLRRTFNVPSIHPTALVLLNLKLPDGRFLIPTPQTNGRYSGSAVSHFQEDQFNLNFDNRFNDRNWLAVKFFFSDAPRQQALASAGNNVANVPGFGIGGSNKNRILSFQDIHTFNSGLVNEARIGYHFTAVSFPSQEPVKDSDVGIMRANADVLPGLPLIRIASTAGGLIVGTSTTAGNRSFASSLTLADTVSMTRGKHTIRTGSEVRYYQSNQRNANFTHGQIDFLDFRSFLTGNTLTSVLSSGIGGVSLRATDYNFFVQDDWKVSPQLTVNLGLRYELDLPPYDTRGRLSTFDPSLYRPPIGNSLGPPSGGFVQAGNVIPQYDLAAVPNVSKRVVKSIDPTNFAPRFGFAYSMLDSNRLVVRGGYGIFYSRAAFQSVSIASTLPPTFILGRRNGAPLADPFFRVPPEGQFPTFVPGIALSGTAFDRNLRAPYFQQYNIGMQYEVVKDMLLDVAYVGTRGLKLFRQVAINQARLASPQHPIINELTGAVITTTTPANVAQRAPFQGVSINGFNQNQSTAQSFYNSLQVSLIKRLSRGLQLLASYTFAKSLDNASGQGIGPGIVGVINPNAESDTSAILGNQLNNRANRGVSDFDRTHRFVLSYIWDLTKPAFTGRSTVGRLFFSNWQVGGIIVAMSGLPIDIVDTGAGSFYGLSGGSNPLARPNLVGDPHSNIPPGYFVNPFAFARPIVPTGQVIPSSADLAVSGPVSPGTPFGTDIGNVGRNVLRGPRQTNVDFSIIKRFGLSESKNIEFRAEFFNLFNHVNLANPISDFNAALSSGGSINPNTGQIINPGDFGRIISTSNNPRLIQFAVKLNF
jgi:hypothetical protein